MIYGYLRTSTGAQDLNNQKLGILNYAQQKKWTVDVVIEEQISSRVPLSERKLYELIQRLEKGDTLIISELSPRWPPQIPPVVAGSKSPT